MICTLTTKNGSANWCERHQERHEGLKKILCLEDSARGERYRGILDRKMKNRKATEMDRVIKVARAVGKMDAGPGTTLKQMLEGMGISQKPNCSCNGIMREMDRLGVAGCRDNAKYLAGRMGANTTFMSWREKISAAFQMATHGHFSFESVILEACDRSEEASKQRAQMNLYKAATVSRNVRPPRPYGQDGLTWAVGLTTVPERRQDLLPRTLSSLSRAGWESPRLFVDGGRDDGSSWVPFLPGLEITYRWPKVTPWSNWWLGLQELLHRSPDADRYMMVQDDVIFVQHLREYLESVPWVPKTYLNLWTGMHNNKITTPDSPGGFIESLMVNPPSNITGPALEEFKKGAWQGGKGALALVFDRDATLALLGSKDAVERPVSGGGFSAGFGRNRIDGGVVDALNKAGYRELVHNPSLCEHTGTESTIVQAVVKRPDGTERIVRNGNVKNDQGEAVGRWLGGMARSFPGEEFNAMKLGVTNG